MTPNRTGGSQNKSCIAPKVKKVNASSVTGMCQRARIIHNRAFPITLKATFMVIS